MITVDATQARTLIANAVSLKGRAHIQEACYYVVNGDDNQPWADVPTDMADLQVGCIVGAAFTELVGIEKMKVLVEHRFNGKSVRSLSSELPELLGITIEPSALSIFSAAQGDQDAGMTWGEVLDQL